MTFSTSRRRGKRLVLAVPFVSLLLALMTAARAAAQAREAAVLVPAGLSTWRTRPRLGHSALRTRVLKLQERIGSLRNSV